MQIARALLKIYGTAFTPVLLFDMFIRWCLGFLPGPAQTWPAIKAASIETLLFTFAFFAALAIWASAKNRSIQPGNYRL